MYLCQSMNQQYIHRTTKDYQKEISSLKHDISPNDFDKFVREHIDPNKSQRKLKRPLTEKDLNGDQSEKMYNML